MPQPTAHPMGRDFFLSQFLEARSPQEFKLPWRLLLGEDPVIVAQQLLAEGLLHHQGSLWRCSAQGQLLANNFLRTQSQQRNRAQQQVVPAFEQGDFEQAATAYLHFESRQPFPSDKGLNPTESSKQSLIEDLQELARARPGLLQSEVSREIRSAAVLHWLWGDSPDRQQLEPPADRGYTHETTVEILIAYVAGLRDLQRYQREGLTRVQIVAADPENCCASCRQQHETFHDIGQAPELPGTACVHNPPCQCFYMPDLG